MGVFVDVVAIAFLIFSAFSAYYKGFVKTFFGFVAVIVAILLASCFSKPFAIRIKESSEIDEWIIDGIVNIGSFEESNKNFTILSGENISGEIIVEDFESGDALEVNENFYTKEIIGFFNSLPDSIENFLDFEDEKNATILSIATKISDGVINIFSWIIIYFVVRIVFAVLIVVFDGIMSFPILKSINNFAGLAIGAFLGFFRIYLFLAIIYFISSLFKISFLVDVIQASGIVNAMYNHNLIINLIF